MKREDLTAFRLKKLCEEEALYDFPDFLRIVRKMHGMNRRYVCQDVSITETRLYYLETGQFKKTPEKEELILIGKFYGIDPDQLMRKVNKFIAEGKCKPKGYKRHEKLLMLQSEKKVS